MSLINLGVLISGRGSNMKAILSEIKAGKIKNVRPSVVISNNPDASGLRVASETFRIPIKVVLSNSTKGWDYDQRIVSVLNEHEVTPKSGLVCLAGFMRIVSPEFVRLYKHRIMNIHPGLLPSFPGLHAQKQAIEYGVKVAGCTVHFVDEGVDSGPIILQKAVGVLDSDSEETLSSRILREEHKLYPLSVKLFVEGKIEVKGRKVFIKN
ncbi:MAG TPA: phosphoribosylglycinamide formyltransferase [Nitrososphaeraceae archaeon]|jgi:phosphoribosylglycinamide formyltransferase 1|nr:phosphoribosylglycinamide formyltransferase [Nitrososphaeraceae archaeon]